MRHVHAGPPASIAHPKADDDILSFQPGRQIVVDEVGVGQAVAEREQRFQVLQVVPLVADRGAFLVDGREAAARRLLLQLGPGELRLVKRERDGGRPDGSTLPKSRWAMTAPPLVPGYQASRTPATLSIHGISAGPGKSCGSSQGTALPPIG